MQEDLPVHCSSVDPIMQQLMDGVNRLKEQVADLAIGIDCYFVDDTTFVEELEILKSRFCAVFQGCVHAGVKDDSTEEANDAEWRSNHDRLLFDFLLRLDKNCSIRAW